MSGWNGSGQKGATPQKPKATAKKPSPVRGIIAGLVIVLAAVAYFVFFSGSEKPQKEKVKVERAPTTIKQVTPAPAPKAKEEPPVQMVTNRFGKVRPKKKPETYTDEHGVLRYKKGNSRVPMSDEEMHKYLVPQIKRQSNIPEFKHECESEIATLLTVEPGEMVFGDIEHDKRWKDDFVQALMEPVEIKEDDSEEDKRIKQEVEATKHELAARLKAGEDIGAVLEETREELRRMAAYKESVMETARDEIMKNATSTADVDAYHEAMNKMLESKGLAPVKMSGLMRRKIKYDLMKAAEKEAAATKGETK